MNTKRITICVMLGLMLLFAVCLNAMPGRDFPPRPGHADHIRMKTDHSSRLMTRLLVQSWGGAWNDDRQICAAYNPLGLCSELIVSDWDVNEWQDTQRSVYTYDAEDRVILIERQIPENGQWIAYQYEVWTYQGDRLVRVETQQVNDQGQYELHFSVDLSYDLESGLLSQSIETFHCFVPGNSPMNRFDYVWDTQRRLSVVQKYQKNQLDDAWQINLRDTYTYLPQDQSSYQDFLDSILFRYAYDWLMEWSGYTGRLYDQHSIEYTPDEGISFLPYFRYDYIYSPDLELLERRYYLTYGNTAMLLDVMRYTMENNNLSNAAHYNFNHNSGEYTPDFRHVYSYSGGSDIDDTNAPAMQGGMTVYPNPSRQSGTISFALAKAAHIRVEVYNLRGQKLTTILNDRRASGSHSIPWNCQDDSGKRVRPGIYLIKLSTGKEQHYSRIVILP